MTADDFEALLKQAGIKLPPDELRAALPAATWLLDVADDLLADEASDD